MIEAEELVIDTTECELEDGLDVGEDELVELLVGFWDEFFVGSKGTPVNLLDDTEVEEVEEVEEVDGEVDDDAVDAE